MSDEPGKTVLDDIIATRWQTLEETRRAVPLDRVQKAAEAREERRDFAAAIKPAEGSGAPGSVRVIAELKRASPSRGLLRQHYRRREIAEGYVAGGAAALSVLTEEHHFLGSLQDLTEVRQAVQLPVLRKDFIIDRYQVYESVAAGADALLLIVAVLEGGVLRSLLDLTRHLRIAALVEVHTEEELKRAVDAGAQMIGVNNRDLKTLEVNLDTSLRLRAKIPAGCIAISESGIKSPADLQRIGEAGFHAVLIGERLMTQQNPGQALQKLLAEAVGTPAAAEAGVKPPSPGMEVRARSVNVSSRPLVASSFESRFASYEKMHTRVKICGVTRWEDAQLAVELGASALGFNFYPSSPRYVFPTDARAIIAKLPPFVTAVGIFADETDDEVVVQVAREARVTAVQVHGPRFPKWDGALASFSRIRGVAVGEGFRPESLRELGGDAFLLDTHDANLAGGTGRPFNWALAREASRFGTIILAGGLTPENVGQAIRAVRPYAVDVATGVELSPGIKDEQKLRRFFAAIIG